MSERFFSSQPISAERVTLAGPEAHHLLHVMRARVGDEVTLFDDSGDEFAAVVESLTRSQAILAVRERRSICRELPFDLVLGVALPKGDRQKWLVEKLTELGVTALVPLLTERGVAQPTGGTLERLQRAIIEASKQCGRNRLMRIAAPQRWQEWIANPVATGQPPASDAAPARRIVAHPGGIPLAAIESPSHQPTQAAIGPEGGLTDDEVAVAVDAGWQPVDLGPRILRVETAAIALAALLAH